MKKKLLVMLLAIVAALCLVFALPACGGSSSGGGQTQKPGNNVIASEGLEYELNSDGKSYSVTGIGDCADTKSYSFNL